METSEIQQRFSKKRQTPAFVSCDLCDTVRRSGAKDIVGHTCAEHFGSYINNKGQGSVWNWVKETGDATHPEKGRSDKRETRGGREKGKKTVDYIIVNKD